MPQLKVASVLHQHLQLAVSAGLLQVALELHLHLLLQASVRNPLLQASGVLPRKRASVPHQLHNQASAVGSGLRVPLPTHLASSRRSRPSVVVEALVAHSRRPQEALEQHRNKLWVASESSPQQLASEPPRLSGSPRQALLVASANHNNRQELSVRLRQLPAVLGKWHSNLVPWAVLVSPQAALVE